ncbi:MAG: glycosyltransferase [Candidatus Liptonbacteria bacterium]|nr:glycosyltransferase [Candidatus Liptonbacteria bacterium]
MTHPLVAKILTSFFDGLNKRGINYAVLRKAELIPENIGNDIDIVIEKRDERMVRDFVGECALDNGFKVYERQNIGGLYMVLYTFVGNELVFLRLDFTNPVKNPGALLAKREKNEKEIYHIPEMLYEKKPKSTLKNILSYPSRLLSPPGNFVVVLGPDGVGKSATAELAAKILEAFHVPVWHAHLGFRPKILPTKQGMFSFGKNKQPPGESRIPGFFRFLYHALDHFLGYWFVIRPLLTKGKTVIGERYYYSHLVDPRPKTKYGIPLWFFKAAFFFMPKPDLAILLSNDASEIYERRQEHTPEEIGRQLEEYRRWGMKAKNFLEIKTDKTLPEVAEEFALQLAPKKYKLAVVATHPIQYQSPLWREIAKNQRIDITVYYCVDWGVSKPQLHKDFFSIAYKWDIPLLVGYKLKFLRNYAPKPRPSIWGLFNPGIFWKLLKNRYDAVIVLGWMDITSWLTLLSAKITLTPIFLRVVNSSNYDKHVMRSKFLLLLKRLYLKIIFRGFVSGFLAIGTWNREMYLEFGAPKERIFHFPYAVWNEFFMEESKKYENSRDEIKRELGIDPKAKVITYAARFVHDKHPEHVIKAYELLISDYSITDTCLLMIGDGELKGPLEKEVAKKGLSNVKFLGFKNQRELIKLYAITDIFVRTDDYIKGDWGATVNEAMACGLPVIAPHTIGAQVDLVRQGENGFVYRLGDIEALAHYIKKIIDNEQLLESMKGKSKEIISDWSYKEDTEGLLKAFRNLDKSFSKQ